MRVRRRGRPAFPGDTASLPDSRPIPPPRMDPTLFRNRGIASSGLYQVDQHRVREAACQAEADCVTTGTQVGRSLHPEAIVLGALGVIDEWR